MKMNLKKQTYYKLHNLKHINKQNTHNLISYETKVMLREKKIYKILYINTNLHIKEIMGLLLKQTVKNNLTKLHLISLKRYNNIYISLFKESPNTYYIEL